MQIDPSLLTSLEALLRLRSVTAAARELHITQSAMSQRLRRLREGLGDPLLVPAGGQLTLTDRAAAMQGPLRQALESLSQAVSIGVGFEPRQARRTFRVASPDVGELFVLPPLMAHLQEHAPGLTVQFQRPDRELSRTLEKLERGTLDLVVGGPMPTERAGLRTRAVGEEPFALLCREGHPTLGPSSTLADYLSCRHVVVSTSDAPGSLVDHTLARLGHSRQVAARVSHFVTAPFVVARSDLVLLTGASLARHMARLLPLQCLPVPLPLPKVPVHMLWHERSQSDPGHRWLRETSRRLTLEAFEALDPR